MKYFRLNSIPRAAGVIPYPFRQDADFLYLTGITQQGVLVLQTSGAQSNYEHKFTLFLPPANPEKEMWDGATLGFAAAAAHFGADAVHPTHEVWGRHRYNLLGGSTGGWV